MTYQSWEDWSPVTETSDFSLYTATCIAGESGSGKTYSALLLARGLVRGPEGESGKIAVLDTENKRALHYRAEFPEMTHFNMSAEDNGTIVGFPPERWIAQIKAIEKAGYKALVIDSFSHAWEGINGVLELQVAELEALAQQAEARAQGRYPVDRGKFSQQSWVVPKARYRRLIEAIVQAKMHVIICVRAKPVIQAYDRDAGKKKNARDTKLRRDDLPFDVACDRDLVFEMLLSMLVTKDMPGQPVLLKCPDHFRGMFTDNRRLSAGMGAAMAKWALGEGDGQDAKKILDHAREIARTKGLDGLTELWKSLEAPQQAIIRTEMRALRALAAEADGAGDNPFDAPQDAPEPAQEDPAPALTEEQMQMAMDQAAAAAEAAAKEALG